MLERLKRRRDFQRVTRARNSAGMPGLVLQACSRQTAESTFSGKSDSSLNADGGNGVRIGFTASKKVGNAVARNRAKRRLRALVEEVMTGHAMPGQDYVLIARNTTGTRAYAALRGDLERALKRLNLWQDRNDHSASAQMTVAQQGQDA